MDELSVPLSDEEMNRLDAFLMERLSEEEEESEIDGGVLDICELDGFLTALVSGPEIIKPSRWLPAIWGELEPKWDALGDMGDVVTLMIRHMNGIANTLLHYPDDFQPLFFEQKMGDQYYTIVDEWCQGYAKGVALSREAWDQADEEVKSLLQPIFNFVGQEAWDKLDRMKGEEVEDLQRLIPPAVKNIYLWWLDRKLSSYEEETDQNKIASFAKAREAVARAGRNEPCPCGSGKQYQLCCLH